MLQWKSNKYYIFWVCVRSLRYPACNAYAPYWHLWSVPLYIIFPHYLIFERKKVTKSYTQCMFLFSLQCIYEAFLILGRNERDMIKMYIVVHVKYPLFLSDCNETWILSTDFEKSPNIKFHENPTSGSRVVPCGRTDRWTHGQTKLIVVFRNFANAPKNAYICTLFTRASNSFLRDWKRDQTVLEEYCWAITWRRKGHIAASRVPLLLTGLGSLVYVYDTYIPYSPPHKTHFFLETPKIHPVS
jgi:hypothetical protein